MTLILTAEEESLRDSVRRFVADRSPLTKVRDLIAAGEPYDAEVWKQLAAQLGLAGLIIPAEYGGAGAGWSALSTALTELGAGLVPSPLLAVSLAAGVLLQLDDDGARDRLLPGIAAGDLIVTLAAVADGGQVITSGDGDDLRLSGELSPVLNGAQADAFLIPARRAGGTVLCLAVSIVVERCKACGFCVEFCPSHVLALSSAFNSKGYHPPHVVHPEKCSGCDLCGMYCPDFAICATKVDSPGVTKKKAESAKAKEGAK